MSADAKVISLHGSAAGRSALARRALRLAARRGAAPGSAPDSGSVVELPRQQGSDPAAAQAGAVGLEQRLAAALALVRRRLEGNYDVDAFGFDPEFTDEVALPLLLPLYRRWFRVEVNGIENVPADGGALLVANHAGGLWPLDAVMTAMAVRLEHPAGRHLRMLGADLLFSLPGVGTVARRTGTTLACAADAERLLASGELVGVWPEGREGIGKPYRDRYKLQRFGRGGFVRAALRAGVPIVPVSIIGAEEIHPVLANVRPLARLLNLPYLPLTPTFPWLGPLGLLPLPSKWYIEFGAPIDPRDHRGDQEADDPADDPATVFELTDRVREAIQETLYRLLVQRRSIWR